MGNWIGRLWRRRKDAGDDGEPRPDRPEFTLEQAEEIRALLAEMEAKHGDERARVRRRLRRKGMYISDFPDVDERSPSAFDRLVREGRVVVRGAGGC